MFVLGKNIISRKHNHPKRNESNDAFNERFKRWEDRCFNAQGKAEIIISKQRHGPTGIIPIHLSQNLQDF